MTTRTRLFSLLLAVIMVISLMPMSALAADEHVHDGENLAVVAEETTVTEAAVCTCESDDPASHAPFCALYAAPEAPVCFCVEQCAEGSVNEWCDVCYFDHAACAASGEEEAAEYAGTIKKVPSYDPNLIKSLFVPYFGPDFTMNCESQSMELCVGQVGTLPVTFDWGPNYNAYYKSPNDYVWPNGYLGEGAAELVADEYPWEFRGLRAGQKRVFMEVRVGETMDVYQFPDIIVTVYDHSYANGFCTRCGGYEPAELVDGYYQIGNGGQMFWFANHINNVDRTASAKLTADINLENRAWSRIGSTGEGNNNFRGHFDGQGHTIEGLQVTAKNAGGGFFGEVRLGTVENFTIKGTVTVAANNVTYVGGVIGSAPGANGDNVPDHNGATIRNITSYVNVTVNDGLTGVGRIGGFIGYANHETLIENCAWYGTIDLGNQTMNLGAGGFIGRVNENSAVTIRNCGAYGSIVNDSVTENVGAFMGLTAKNSNTVIENCLFAGSVSGSKASSVTPFGTWSGTSKTLTNSYYINTLQTTDADAVKVTAAQLASGEVAYKLGSAWGQTIGTNNYPVLGGAKVNYGYTSCGDNAGKVYTNGQVTDTKPAHNWTEKNGVCTVCGYECTVHSYDNGKCTVCGTVCAHIFENYICTVCGYKCIEHSWGEWETVPMHPMVGGGPSPENHKHSCAICGLEEKAPHTFAYVDTGWGDSHRKVCTECPYKDEQTRGCSGGTATCTEKAICQYCGASYGKLNSHNYDNGFCTACGDYEPAELVDDGYYEIGNAGQLYWFAKQVNSGQTTINGKLTNNIVINENVLNADGTLNNGSYRTWNPIGAFTSTAYGGTFDGNGKTISGLYIDNTLSSGKGLFGYISDGGKVQNVGVIDSFFSVAMSVGGVAVNNEGTIINCYYMGTLIATRMIGGVVRANYGSVSNCYYSGKISAYAGVDGGVVGHNNTSGTVTNCYYNSTLYNGRAIYNNDGGTATNVEGKPTEQFKSGEVAYLLGDAFGQTIGTEDYPVLGGAKVYYADTHCGDEEILGYTNTETPAHNWSNSVCTVCSKVCEHAYEDGVCTECGKVCVHAYEDGKCTVCGEECEHVYVDGKCTICDEMCEHVYEDGICTECGKVCDHTFDDDGICTVCGDYEPATLVNDYYQISNAAQLYWFAKQVNAGQRSINGKLTANIVVNENVLNTDGTLRDGSFHPWTPIGDDTNIYTGIFDGDNHTISGLYFSNSETKFVGLFGYVGKCTIKDVGVVDSYFSGYSEVGGLVGRGENGTVTNCYNTGTVSGTEQVGGVAGSNNSGSVTNCYNTGAVSGVYYVGGVVGRLDYGTVTNCYNTGIVSATETVAGVVGCNMDSTVTNCYNTGTVSGTEQVGGVVGYNFGTVTNSYSIGAVSGDMYVGGVVGNNTYGTVTNCYNTGAVSGKYHVGGVVGDNYSTVTDCYSIGAVSGEYRVGGVVGINYGNVTNSYYDKTVYSGNAIGESNGCTVTNVEGKSTEQFNSGEVAYLLGEAFGQTIGTEAYPVLGGAKVYSVTNCKNEAVYNNTNEAIGHSFGEDGYCTVCGAFDNTGDAKLGDNTVALPEGCEGYYWTYIAEADGELLVTISGEKHWCYVINNKTTQMWGDTQWSDGDPVVNPCKVAVSKGDELEIVVSAYDPTNPWGYPAATLTVTLKYENSVAPFAFAGSNVKLGDSLDMFFYVKYSDLNGEGYYAEITRTFGDGTANEVTRVPYAEWEHYNSSMIRIAYTGLPAKAMTDDITVVVYNNDGVAVSETKTDSIKTYAMRIFDKQNDKTKKVLVDMLNYGAAAQKYFDNYNGNKLANADLTAEQQEAYATKTVSPVDSRVKGDNYAGSSVSLKSNLILTFYFYNLSTDMYAEITYVDHNGDAIKLVVDGEDFYARTNTMYGVDATGIKVADGMEMITCKVFDKDGNEVASATDSVESYIARMSETDEIFESVMKFVVSAYHYFES